MLSSCKISILYLTLNQIISDIRSVYYLLIDILHGGCGRLYQSSPKLLSLRDRLYEPFKDEDPFTAKQPRLPGLEI
jgi:hypothetical protein